MVRGMIDKISYSFNSFLRRMEWKYRRMEVMMGIKILVGIGIIAGTGNILLQILGTVILWNLVEKWHRSCEIAGEIERASEHASYLDGDSYHAVLERIKEKYGTHLVDKYWRIWDRK